MKEECLFCGEGNAGSPYDCMDCNMPVPMCMDCISLFKELGLEIRCAEHAGLAQEILLKNKYTWIPAMRKSVIDVVMTRIKDE